MGKYPFCYSLQRIGNTTTHLGSFSVNNINVKKKMGDAENITVLFHYEVLLSLIRVFLSHFDFGETDVSVSSWGPILIWYSKSIIQSKRQRKKKNSKISPYSVSNRFLRVVKNKTKVSTEVTLLTPTWCSCRRLAKESKVDCHL